MGLASAADDTYLSSPALKAVEPDGALKTVEQGPTSGQQLLELLLSLNNTQANFQQTLLDFRGQVLDQSSGTLTLSKPSLRWQLNSPFTQVIVVADGLLRIYDPDLDQVIEKDMSGSDEALPLKLLLDPTQLLAGDYRINKISLDGDVQFLLQPSGNQSLFTSVRLAFMGQQLSQLEITDHVGQRTLVTFSGIRSRQKIPASTFELDLPANTEVVRG
jgi:outer membrane lipoprotein carrier protein|tara:strand:- start:1119 stop:1769 length:651 start_codon:yes stop_codon:yes gene_type:complete